MRIRLINPNATATMTDKIVAAARAVATPGTAIEGVTSASGPISIEGFFDGALAGGGFAAAHHHRAALI